MSCYSGLTRTKLDTCLSQAEFGEMYTERNVAISGIHTHSGPGGYLQYVLYDITSLGFVKQSWEAVVSGIVEVCTLPRKEKN